MRRSLPGIFCSAIPLFLIALWIGNTASVCTAATHPHDDPALARIEVDRESGALDPDTADLLRLQRIFAPEDLPVAYRELAIRPLRCATPLLFEYTRGRADLAPAVRKSLDAWLLPRSVFARAASYLSQGGHFQLTYEVSGANVVPLDDVDPANGVPDFVERCARYLEESWALQFADLGFVPPDLTEGPYPVSFQSMGTYGYTTTQGAGSAGTRIVLNNDFLGFPPNDDPEGDAIGAAKVTCVHELRHASQFATSGWSEPGLWVEVDATWIEDIGYDDVNDFYNYLASGSPISNPTLPLDAGGSGSYEDCVWQHYLTERWSVGVIQEFWNRRASNPVEDVMTTYDGAMQGFGGSVLENFVEFAAWNLATGTRAWPSVGYQEANRFPTAPYSEQADSLPATFTNTVQRYAARLSRFTGFTESESGVAVLTFNRPPNSPLRARAVILTRAGTRVVEPLALTGLESRIELTTRARDIAELSVVVAHGGIGIGAQSLTLTVEEIERPAAPSAESDTTQLSFIVESGKVVAQPLFVRNTGEAGSSLNIAAVTAKPVVATAARDAGSPLLRSIAGSFVGVNLAEYAPGSSVTRTFSVANASRDFEWLAGVEITVPAGVTVLGSSDFVGGTDGPLVTNAATGEATTVVWSDLNGSWGNVRNGQLATANLWLEFELQLVGDLTFSYRILGDGYGSNPHEVTGSLVLSGPQEPLFEILAPVAHGPTMIGSTVDIEWITGFEGDVGIELSRDGGATWEAIADSTENDGHFSWLVTGPATTEGRLRMRRIGTASLTTSPATLFLLEPAPWISVSPSEATIPASLETTLQLTIDASTLAAGAYRADVFVFHDAPDSPLRVEVRLDVIDLGTPGDSGRDRIQLQFASPNPFNPSTTLGFELLESGRVCFDVFDARGRHVRKLLDRELPLGPHAVAWDSRDDHGAYVSSGVYYFVASVEGQRHTGKVVLSK